MVNNLTNRAIGQNSQSTCTEIKRLTVMGQKSKEVYMSENVASESIVSGSAPIQQQSEVPTEKMVPQSEVDKVAGSVRKEGYEKGRREALAELQAAQVQAQSHGGLTPEEVRKIAIEATQAQQQDAANLAVAQKIIGEVTTKLNAGYQKFSDFEPVVKTLKLNESPLLFKALNAVDNADEVAYEIAKSSRKRLLMKQASRSPADYDDLVEEIRNISESIKTNKTALSNAKPVKQPLGQVKPSSTGVGSDGPTTVAEFKKMSWLKN
jgi:hypothetical protein